MVWGLAAAGFLALAICLIALPLGRVLGVMDIPDGVRHRHKNPTPMTGGLAVMAPSVLAAGFFAITTDFFPLYAGVGALMVVFLGVGLLDDRGHLRPILRLALSGLAVLALMFVIPATTVTFFHFSFLGVALFLTGWWGLGFTAISMVGLQNALNMADGKNGLGVGLCVIWVALLMPYAPGHLMPLLAVMLVALAVTAGFNLAGRVFLGDSGTYSISVTIGVLTVYVYNVNFSTLHADIVALWFLIPVVDALRLILYRIMSGRSPFSSDSFHFYHVLEKLMPWRWGLVGYLTLVAAPGIAARMAPDWTILWAASGLAIYGAVVAANHWDAQARRMRLRLRQEG